MDLQQFLSALRTRWKFSVVTFLLGIATTAAILILATPLYASSVKLFISTPSGGQAEYAASFIVTQRVASYADFATDPAVLQSVVDQLDLDVSYERLGRRIDAEVVFGTQTVQIDVRAETPQLAQQIAEATAAELVDLSTRLEAPALATDAPAIAVRVAGEPSFSNRQVSPNILINSAIGVIVSLFLAIAGAVLRDLLDRTVKSRQEMETITGRAVLGALPYDPQVKKQPEGQLPGGQLAEAFRVLRTNLQYADLDAQQRTILVSSPVPADGKTTTATNLALSMAQAGRSVLLVDADMRNPNVASRLGLENVVGVVTVLVGRTSIDEAIQPHSSGLSFMGTGPMVPNPAEVLETGAMTELLSALKTRFDTVIVDAPPMLPVADASILMTEVDGALLVARHGATTREQLRLAVSRIDAVGGRLFGTVLNRTPQRGAGSYGYAYGYSYGYGTTPGVEDPPSRTSWWARRTTRAGHRADD